MNGNVKLYKDLPKIITDMSQPVIFDVITSILDSKLSPTEF